MLDTKWYSYNCNKIQQSRYQMTYSKPYSRENKPDDIAKNA